MGRSTSTPQQVLMSDRQVDTQSKAAGQAVFSSTGKPPGSNHDKYGGNLLFCDGHVELIPAQHPIRHRIDSRRGLIEPKMKIQCSCGAKYEFDVTPAMTTNPVKFVCPACGVDASEFVDSLVRQELGQTTTPAGVPQPVVLLGTGSRAGRDAARSPGPGTSASPGGGGADSHTRSSPRRGRGSR